MNRLCFDRLPAEHGNDERCLREVHRSTNIPSTRAHDGGTGRGGTLRLAVVGRVRVGLGLGYVFISDALRASVMRRMNFSKGVPRLV